MKPARNVTYVLSAALTLLLAACGPTATPAPTALPATPPPVTEAPTVLPSPTSVARIAVTGPESGSRITWVDGSTLVYIPPSEFTMGSGAGDAPEHAITLDGYWIQQTKVTNQMYAQCVSVGVCTPPTQEIGGPVYSNPAFSNHPVVGVTWDQSQAYCAWAQGRLPTEAEWEKAARGTDSRLYPWGNDEPACDLLNFAQCIGHTTDVTAYPDAVSAFGLYDMAGNVFEWVADWYSETYYSESPLANPTGPETGEQRVIRGSSFETDDLTQVSVAIRRPASPTRHSRDTGFRCVVTQPQPLAPYCQLSAYVPTGIAQAGECELPVTDVAGQYCAGGNGFTTVDLPEGATYEVLSQDLDCTEAVIDGQRRLTCIGPRGQETTHEITVCNPACSTSPSSTGAEPACDPGYTLAPGTASCNYTPIVGQVDVAGCPAGYVLVDNAGQKSCLLGPGPNGQCPSGLYFDTLAGACVPPNGQTEAPYGIDNPGLASQSYQGCAPGYTYDETFQCCQAQTGGTYPGCSPGSTFNADLGACSPSEVKLSGPGCVTLSVTVLKCSEPVDICEKITTEIRCLRNSYACSWNETEGKCELKD